MRPLLSLPVRKASSGLVSCTECAKCCTYVSVGINEPYSVRFASDVLWYLYHERVSVYRDGEGEWSVVFATTCRQLGADRLCRVYPDRPLICRGFDNTTCEVNDPRGGLSFEDPESFLRFLRKARPRVFRALVARAVPAELAARLET